MLSVIRDVSWLFVQTSRHTGPVSELRPCDTGVWESSSGCVQSEYKLACALVGGITVYYRFLIHVRHSC
jgi:hypothetical protein